MLINHNKVVNSTIADIKVGECFKGQFGHYMVVARSIGESIIITQLAGTILTVKLETGELMTFNSNCVITPIEMTGEVDVN